MTLALLTSALRGDAEKVDQLLAQSPQFHGLDKTDYRNRTALHLAVERGHYEVVETLIAHGVDLAAKDCAGFTALHLAAELGHAKIVTRLLQENSKLAIEPAYDDLNCLHLAIIGGHATIVQQLLATNLDLMKPYRGLHFAVKYGREEIVAIFMESVKATGYERDVFESALSYGYDQIASQLLTQNPHLANDKAENGGMDLLYFGAFCGCHTTMTQLLAARSHSTDVVGYSGKTVLNLMAQYGFDTIVAQLLVEKPHLIDVKGLGGQNVLHFAAKGGHENIVALLLAARPALIREKDERGQTALHQAAARGRDKVVAQLLAHDPGLIDLEDRYRDTALQLAVFEGHSPAAECLLAHGAIGAEKLLFELLWQSSSPKPCGEEGVKLLLAHKPELIRSVDSWRSTPLHCVFDSSRFQERVLFSEDLMRTIWQLNPEALHQTNMFKRTPLDIALENDNQFAIELVQGQLSLEQYAQLNRPCPQSLLDQLWGSLMALLHKDVAGVVHEYLGLESSKNLKRRRDEQ